MSPAGDVRLPVEAKTVTELIRVLSGERPQHRLWAPPLVYACEVLAHQPHDGCRPELADWVAAWAHDRRAAGGEEKLKRVQGARSRLSADRLCVTVTVREMQKNPGLYTLTPYLSGAGEPQSLDVCYRDVSQQQIPGRIKDAIDEASKQAGGITELDDLLVELVVPASLHGWRFEHEKELRRFAISFRSWEILDKHLSNTTVQEIQSKWRQIADHQPSIREWSETISWLTCTDDSDVVGLADKVSIPGQGFCFGLAKRAEPGSGQRDGGKKPPWRIMKSKVRASHGMQATAQVHASGGASEDGLPVGLDEVIGKGAPIVVSLLGGESCQACVLSGEGCQVTQRIEDIKKLVNKRSGGLRDLPYIARDIRRGQVGGPVGSLRIGVYLEHMRRLAVRDDLESQRREAQLTQGIVG
jgi:hypothetical protein